MSYALQVLKDSPLVFWPMDEAYPSKFTNLASSGPGNNVDVAPPIVKEKMPLVYGLKKSFSVPEITVIFPTDFDYNGNENPLLLSTNSSFTIEAWVRPLKEDYYAVTNPEFQIFADSSLGGLYIQLNTIRFKIGTQEIFYSCPNVIEALHIVALYQPSKISLYVNGNLVVSKDFLMSEQTIELQTSVDFRLIGQPIDSNVDDLLVNAIAFYKYILTESQIKTHYQLAQPIPSIQVVGPKGGQIFEFRDDNVSTQFVYTYPGSKSWEYFTHENLYYNAVDQTLSMTGAGMATASTIDIYDYITIPSGPTINDSKIEWKSSGITEFSSVTVETSLDGITYELCTSGKSIPQYQLNNDGNISSRELYIKIVFYSQNDANYLPWISNLSLSFYKDQITYSNNSGNVFSITPPDETNTVSSVNLPNTKSSILSTNSRNGVLVGEGSEFNINVNSDIYAIELFYTPTPLDVTPGDFDASIFDSPLNSTHYKTGPMRVPDLGQISKVIVNGVDKTAVGDMIDVLDYGKLHHIFFILESPISGEIKFHNFSNIEALYQNITFYPKPVTEDDAIDNYLAYTNPTVYTVSDLAFSVTENSVESYNNDWIVVQNS